MKTRYYIALVFVVALGFCGKATRDKSSVPPHLQGEGRWIDRDTGCGVAR